MLVANGLNLLLKRLGKLDTPIEFHLKYAKTVQQQDQSLTSNCCSPTDSGEQPISTVMIDSSSQKLFPAAM